MRDHEVPITAFRLKADPAFCGCGCGVEGRPGRVFAASILSPEQVHVRGCTCPTCTSGLARTPMPRTRPKPKRTAAEDAAYKAAVEVVAERAGGMCELRFAPSCTRRGTHVHHVRQQRFGLCDDPEWLRWTCWICNNAVEADPERAVAAGLIDPDWRREGAKR